jgi:hypothetical protein
MHHRLFRWEPDRPTFPERGDLQHLADEPATRALRLLRLLVDEGLADTYSQPVRDADGRLRWNVWLDAQLVPPGGQRLTLEQWAVRELARNGGEDAPA